MKICDRCMPHKELKQIRTAIGQRENKPPHAQLHVRGGIRPKPMHVPYAPLSRLRAELSGLLKRTRPALRCRAASESRKN